jgi:hypothetical protein
MLDIHYKLVLTFGEEAYSLTSGRDRIHELKTWRIILADDDRPEKSSIDHIDMLIVKILITSF